RREGPRKPETQTLALHQLFRLTSTIGASLQDALVARLENHVSGIRTPHGEAITRSAGGQTRHGVALRVVDPDIGNTAFVGERQGDSLAIRSEDRFQIVSGFGAKRFRFAG